jgi:hypothetical protein
MVIVLLQYRRDDSGLENLAAALATEMPEILASRLDASSQDGDTGRLTPNDVKVFCNESGRLDVNTDDLQIVIWAPDSFGRKFFLQRRKEEIIKDVADFISGWEGGEKRKLSKFVQIFLQPTAFGRF